MGDFLLRLIAFLVSFLEPLAMMCTGLIMTKIDHKGRDFTTAFYAAAFALLYLQN